MEEFNAFKEKAVVIAPELAPSFEGVGLEVEPSGIGTSKTLWSRPVAQPSWVHIQTDKRRSVR